MIDFEIASLYFFAIASFLCMILSIILALKFKNSRQLIPWSLISLSFVFDFIPNISMIFQYYQYLDFDLIPYPSFMDVFWIFSYGFFGVGAMLYFYNIQKMIDKKKAKRNAELIIAGAILSFIFSYPLLDALGALNDLAFDPLYFSVPFFASIACIPIYYLFKGGRLSRYWVLFASGGFGYMIGEVFYLMKDLVFNYSLADVFYSISYILFIAAFIGMLKNK